MRSLTHILPLRALGVLLSLLAAMTWQTTAGAQTDPAPQSLPYSQDFGALPWTSTSYPAGLQGWRLGATSTSFDTGSPTQDRALQASSDASLTADGLHNFDGKIGPLSANGDNVALALALNTTGRSGIVVSYEIMTIRNHQDGTNDRVNEVTLQYRVGTIGSFSTLSGMGYENLSGAGNDQTGSGVTTPQNLQSRNVTLPAECDDQAVVQLRWATRDVTGSGDYPSFALDYVTASSSLTIAASAGTGGTIDPSGNTAVVKGSNQSFTITPDACYHIADVLVDDVSVGPVASYEFTDVQADHTIAASFALNTFAIDASAGKGGSISPSGAVSVDCGANQSFDITPAACYHIVDVLVDGVSVGPVASYEFTDVQAHHTIAASFAVNTFTIDASAGSGGSIGPSGAVSVNCGASQTFNITPATCHQIADVLVDGVSVGPVASYQFTDVQANHTIAASFVLGSHTITASAGTGGSISPSGAVSVGCGANQTFNITADGCHHIADVLVDGISVGPVASYQFTDIQANHTIAASFALNTFTITASAGSGGSISPSGAVSVSCGASQTFSITPAACHQIADVLVDGISVGPVSSYEFTDVQNHRTISASFVLGSHTISASAGSGGSINPSGPVSVNCGATQAFTITAASCHHIADVLVDGVSVGAVGSYQFSDVQANHTIAASFAPDTYTITASAGAGGSIGPSGVESVNCGANSSFVITPDACYRITDVLVDGASVGPVTSYGFSNVQAHHTIAASFGIITYAIQTTAGAGGSITPTGPRPFGTEAAMAATIYVDGSNPSCSNSGPGTQAQPYCTISAAVSNQGVPGNTILVSPGTYREQVSVSASGTSGNPFVIRAAAPGVLVDGSDDFSNPGLWTLHSGDVWLAASVTWVPKQVFKDGVRLTVSTADPAALPPNSFRAASGGLYVNAGGGNPGNHQLLVGRRLSGFRMSGRTWVTIEGFTVTRTEDKAIHASSGSSRIVVTGNTASWAASNGIGLVSSSDCEVRDNIAFNNGDHGILLSAVTGSTVEDNESYGNARPNVRAANGIHLAGSSGNQVRRNRAHHNQDTGEQFNTGSNNNVSTQNLSWANGDHGFDHLGSTGTIHFGDIAHGNWKNGFSIEGNSPGTQLFNCIAIENGLNTNEVDLLVDASSVTNFVSNSNVFWKSTAQPVVQFGSSSPYTSVAAYSAATGHDALTVQADPRFANAAAGDFHLLAGSPAIDNADASLANWPALDFDGNVRVDDPATANQGLGAITYADRGAFEFLPAGNGLPVNCGASQSFAITADPGYHILNVAVDGNSLGAITSYTFTNVQGDHTLEATFEQNSVAVFQPLVFDVHVNLEGIEVRWQIDRALGFGEPELQRADQARGPWTAIREERRRDGDVTSVLDRNVRGAKDYYYRLVVRSGDLQQVFGPIQTHAAERINESALTAVGPNPARGPVDVGFAVARHEHVRLSVLDIQGRVVDVLADEAFRPGRYSLVWSGRTRRGSRASAGVYFVEYRAGDRSSVKRFVLTR